RSIVARADGLADEGARVLRPACGGPQPRYRNDEPGTGSVESGRLRPSPQAQGDAMIRLLEPLAGKLLVATPRLQDPNFVRTVVLMLMHDEQGALGVVLNRKLDLDVEQVLPAWAPHVAPPAQLFLGGPVEPTAAVAVARTLPE